MYTPGARDFTTENRYERTKVLWIKKKTNAQALFFLLKRTL